MKSKDVIKALAALAQETRLGVFRLLVKKGPEGLPAGEIGASLGLANTTLSFHLKELSNAGLLDSRQEGRFVIYSTNLKTMNALLAYLTENCCAESSVACMTNKAMPCLPKGNVERKIARRRA